MSAPRRVRSGRARRRRPRHRRLEGHRGRTTALTIVVVGLAGAVAAVGWYSVLPDPPTTSAPLPVAEAAPPVVTSTPGAVRANRPPATVPERTAETSTPPPAARPKQSVRGTTSPPPPMRTAPKPVLIRNNGLRTFAVAPGPAAPAKRAKLVRYTVEVERGLTLVPATVATMVDATLADKRSWRAAGYTFQRVASGGDVRILLSTPGTTDLLCAPLDTGGEVSCRNENLVVLNAKRWLLGAASYGLDLVNYRHYLVNHEVGHFLGRGHVGCPGPGRLAPVMLQQTISLEGCRKNPWPAASLP
jgi:uncharacterized protein DUF3152